MIRSKGEAGTGNVVEATRHMRSILGDIRRLQSMDENELYSAAKEHRAPYDLIRNVAENGRLPVVTFTAGGLATPARHGHAHGARTGTLAVRPQHSGSEP